jgi:hypothetical protein
LAQGWNLGSRMSDSDWWVPVYCDVWGEENFLANFAFSAWIICCLSARAWTAG